MQQLIDSCIRYNVDFLSITPYYTQIDSFLNNTDDNEYDCFCATSSICKNPICVLDRWLEQTPKNTSIPFSFFEENMNVFSLNDNALVNIVCWCTEERKLSIEFIETNLLLFIEMHDSTDILYYMFKPHITCVFTKEFVQKHYDWLVDLTTSEEFNNILRSIGYMPCDFVVVELSNVFDKCPICLETNNYNWVKTSCNHVYHNECIQSWIIKSNLCPMCRTNLK